MSVATLNDLSHLTDVTVPDGMDLTPAELEAAKRITHIANTAADRFQAVAHATVDIEKDPATGRDRKVISFRFADAESGEITNSSSAGEYRTVSFMEQNTQLRDAFIKSPEGELKMDLDALSTLSPDKFTLANEDAKQYGPPKTLFVERIQVPTHPVEKGRE